MWNSLPQSGEQSFCCCQISDLIPGNKLGSTNILFKRFTRTLMNKIIWYHPYFKKKYWNHSIQEVYKNIDKQNNLVSPVFQKEILNHSIQEVHKNIDEENKLVSPVFQKQILKSFYSRTSQEHWWTK